MIVSITALAILLDLSMVEHSDGVYVSRTFKQLDAGNDISQMAKSSNVRSVMLKYLKGGDGGDSSCESITGVAYSKCRDGCECNGETEHLEGYYTHLQQQGDRKSEKFKVCHPALGSFDTFMGSPRRDGCNGTMSDAFNLPLTTIDNILRAREILGLTPKSYQSDDNIHQAYWELVFDFQQEFPYRFIALDNGGNERLLAALCTMLRVSIDHSNDTEYDFGTLTASNVGFGFDGGIDIGMVYHNMFEHEESSLKQSINLHVLSPIPPHVKECIDKQKSILKDTQDEMNNRLGCFDSFFKLLGSMIVTECPDPSKLYEKEDSLFVRLAAGWSYDKIDQNGKTNPLPFFFADDMPDTDDQVMVDFKRVWLEYFNDPSPLTLKNFLGFIQSEFGLSLPVALRRDNVLQVVQYDGIGIRELQWFAFVPIIARDALEMMSGTKWFDVCPSPENTQRRNKDSWQPLIKFIIHYYGLVTMRRLPAHHRSDKPPKRIEMYGCVDDWDVFKKKNTVVAFILGVMNLIESALAFDMFDLLKQFFAVAEGVERKSINRQVSMRTLGEYCV